MTLAIALTFALLVGTLIIFALDRYPIDFVALSILATVLILGPILGVRPEEAISGFSNPATITVMAMFILSSGIERSGAVNVLARHLVRLAGKGDLRQLLAVIGVVGPVSAFINNTAAVAILMPVIISLARSSRRSPAKLLIPLSFFSQLAGVMTLIGTSTNVLASSLAAREGYGQFGMFEFSVVGLPIFLTGALYFLLLGRKLLPNRRTETEITENYQIKEYLSEVIIQKGSPLVGKNLAQCHLREQYDIHVLEILRHDQKMGRPLAQHALQTGDILFIKGNRPQLLKVKKERGLALAADSALSEQDLESDKMGLLEVVVGPNSDVSGDPLESTNFRHRYGCTVIAIQKHGELIQERLGQVTLGFGDTLLLRGPTPALEQVKREPGFIVTEQLEIEAYRTEKIPIAVAILAGVVLLAVLGQPILVTALAGCVLMVLTGCLRMNELHEAIRWDVIFLLAGVIPLGLAMEKSGGAQLLADLAAQSANYVSPLMVLAIFYVITMLLTELISNNATVVVMVPVGVATAEVLGLDARAFILAIMFAASTSFSTPVGYQTNTMVYGPGGYKFFDFVRVGGPLNLLLAVLTPLYIYLLWGL
ncbi:MAG: SLC13 family permease [Anaerolineae bacterium]|nr:SLC13 family permease [Anaerolineae bacterium]